MSGHNPGYSVRVYVEEDSVIPPYFLRGAKVISVRPGTGATASVYKSVSPEEVVLSDESLGFLDFNEFEDLDYAGSIWWKWASGDITEPTSEGYLDTYGWSWLIVRSVGGTSVVEVAW